VQEVSYQAWRSYESFDPERGSFRGWMFGVASKVALALLRRTARARANVGPLALLESRAGAVPAELTTISRRVARDEALERFLARAEELDPEDRDLLLYRGIEGLQHDQVAAILGLTPETASKRWQRLRDRLRDVPEARGLLG
jgi:RNA polymerase sigma-70 factor (ECF subfamily)